jgi:hypothetical protein
MRRKRLWAVIGAILLFALVAVIGAIILLPRLTRFSGPVLSPEQERTVKGGGARHA